MTIFKKPLLKNQPLKRAGSVIKTDAKKVGHGVKTVAKKVGGGVSKLGTKLVTIAKNTGENVAYAPILPFKQMMIHLLDSRGVKHTNKIDDIAKKFHTHIVSKNFDDTLESISSDPNFAFEQATDMYSLTDAASEGVGNTIAAGGQAAAGDYGGAIASLVKAIVAWIKNAKDKKARGEKLTAEEEKGLKDAENAAAQLADAGALPDENAGTIENIATTLWNWLMSPTGLALLAIIAVLIVVSIVRKKKTGK